MIILNFVQNAVINLIQIQIIQIKAKKSESKGFLSGFIKGIRDQIPDEYVDKIKDNEIVDDAVTHAKIIWHGPQTEKEKAYKERKRQEEEKKDPIKYKISEVTGKRIRQNNTRDDISSGSGVYPYAI